MGENIRTFEELLIERINKTLTALDNESFEQFDHIMENTEILLKIKKGLYDIYMKWKNYYGRQLQLAYEEIGSKVSGIDDPYTKKMQKDRNEAIAEWGYRLDLLQKLISLLNDYNLVPFGTPEYAEIQSETAPSEVPPDEQQSVQQEPEPVQKSPQEILAEDMERLQREEQEIANQQKQDAPKKKIRFAPTKK